MYIKLSTGHILNLAHVATIQPFNTDQRMIQVKLACGQSENIRGVTQEDYDTIIRMVIQQKSKSA